MKHAGPCGRPALAQALRGPGQRPGLPCSGPSFKGKASAGRCAEQAQRAARSLAAPSGERAAPRLPLRQPRRCDRRCTSQAAYELCSGISASLSEGTEDRRCKEMPGQSELCYLGGCSGTELTPPGRHLAARPAAAEAPRRAPSGLERGPTTPLGGTFTRQRAAGRPQAGPAASWGGEVQPRE